MNIHDILAEAEHESAAAESLPESAARVASGETSVEQACLSATLADLRASLSDRRSLAKTV